MSPLEIVCPFCSLGCDVVQVNDSQVNDSQVNDGQERPTIEIDCELAHREFQQAMQPSPARVATQTVSLDGLEKHLHKIAATAKSLVVVTRGVDLATSKSLERMAAARQITWCLDQSPLAQAWQRTSSRDGVISASFAEVRQHADLVWLVGDPVRQAPRLKQVISTSESSDHIVETNAPLDLDELARLVMVTREAVETSLPRWMERLAAAIIASKYFVVILGDDAFAPQDAGAGTSLIVKWIWKLNADRRAVALYLDEAAMSRSVYRWRTNHSLPPTDTVLSGRSSDAEASPEIDNKSLVIRLGDPANEASETNGCDIAIGTRDPGPEQASVFVPCSVVGVHHAGATIRGDATVTLPLARFATSPLPTAIQWLEMLSRRTLRGRP